MTVACLALAAVIYAPLAALSWPAHVPSAKVLLSIGGLAVVCTAAAFLLFFGLISEAGPARASVITYINPAIAVSLGVAVLGEKVTPIMLAAFATILVGSVLATRSSRVPAEAEPGKADAKAEISAAATAEAGASARAESLASSGPAIRLHEGHPAVVRATAGCPSCHRPAARRLAEGGSGLRWSRSTRRGSAS